MGSGEWLLAVIGAVAAQPPACPPQRMPLEERRAELEEMLRARGLAYGTGAQDPAIELDPQAAPGVRRKKMRDSAPSRLIRWAAWDP